jgi:hypothetical protein
MDNWLRVTNLTEGLQHGSLCPTWTPSAGSCTRQIVCIPRRRGLDGPLGAVVQSANNIRPCFPPNATLVDWESNSGLDMKGRVNGIETLPQIKMPGEPQ